MDIHRVYDQEYIFKLSQTHTRDCLCVLCQIADSYVEQQLLRACRNTLAFSQYEHRKLRQGKQPCIQKNDIFDRIVQSSPIFEWRAKELNATGKTQEIKIVSEEIIKLSSKPNTDVTDIHITAGTDVEYEEICELRSKSNSYGSELLTALVTEAEQETDVLLVSDEVCEHSSEPADDGDGLQMTAGILGVYGRPH